MASWNEFETAAPELAERVKALFDAHKHKTLATLRKDGAPRISGTEVEFKDGDLWIGSMWQAVKAKDLQRDPRYALHSATFDPDDDWPGEAKVAGIAHETEPVEFNGGPSHAFRLEVNEASWCRVNDEKTKLLIDVWTPERGVHTLSR